jgi:hypothetical protein
VGFPIEKIKAWRGLVLRALYKADPEWLAESLLLRSLHSLGNCPPREELLHVLSYLRDEDLIESKDVGKPGAPQWRHRILAAGIEIATGETEHEHIWVMK